MKTLFWIGSLMATVGLTTPPLSAQETPLEERVKALEAENAELARRFDLLAAERDDDDSAGFFAEIGDRARGLGPAASKVYGVDSGVSLGGYGEAIYQNYSGDAGSTADFLRAVLYFGYRFDDNWLFNSEIEFEHASTGKNGEASVEFAYLDYRCSDDVSVRGGLLLVPMGFINELHEPQTYLGATRPEVERRIIPSTWREIGVGVVGDAGPVSYRAYAVGGFDGAGFDDSGLRGGRQKGSEAKAEDIALVARVDWVDTPGVVVGGSVYFGDSGQGTAGLGDTATSIVEVHGEFRSRGVWARGLYAMADVDDVLQLNAASGAGPTASVGEELNGGYLEIGYDVWSLIDPDSESSVSPYVRYEMIDTQAAVPTGFVSNPANDFDILTVGVNFRPIDQVVIKLDFQDFEATEDRVNLSVGYAF